MPTSTKIDKNYVHDLCDAVIQVPRTESSDYVELPPPDSGCTTRLGKARALAKKISMLCEVTDQDVQVINMDMNDYLTLWEANQEITDVGKRCPDYRHWKLRP